MLHQHAHESPRCELPTGLVGTRCTARIQIEGREVNCLLDTGSQVTTIPKSYYDKYLCKHPMKSLEHFLEVEGANGQAVPYLGYVELNLKFPESFLGVEAEVPTLALIVPDLTNIPQILIGTNSLDVLYADCTQRGRGAIKSLCYGYQAVINVLQKRKWQASSGTVRCVKLKGNQQEVVPAGCTVVLDGLIHVTGPLFEKWVSVEPPTTSSLPGGLLVASCLHSLPSRQRFAQLPVVVRNDTQTDLVIPPKTVIAEVHAVQRVMKKEFSKVDAGSEKMEPSLSKIPIDFGDSPLSSDWKERITSLLNSMPDVFALHDLDYGHTDQVKHRIKLSDDTPFKHRARPIHPQDVDAVRQHLQELLEAGVIRESESPFSSPIVVVRKKNNSVRLCIDFRKLNSQTIKDAYALPNLEEAFSVLTGSRWFSVLDLKSGYYQIEMEESDKQKTAFVCPLGFWEFNRMPQGITNAPSTFQRLMERCMGDLNRKEVLVFIDDLIVFSRTLEEHEARLKEVLKRLREFKLKLSPEKCKFCQTSVKYLGHIVSQSGVETDPAKVEALKTWPRPKTLKELRAFLGFSGYYRRFVQDYSKIVKPLNDLTAGYPPLQKGRKKKTDEAKQYFSPKEQFGERWTPECQRAFDTVIAKLTSAPVLGFANPKLPYVLHTDASTTGLGAALYQEQDGQMRVIAFASRGLTRSEAKYPAHKLEFLALKWAVTTKFNDYLYGTDFTVITDSNPLTYILSSAKLDATSYRWLSSLSTFTFKIQYRAGSRNQDADGLSRRPQEEVPDDQETQKEMERIRQFTHHHLTEDSSMIVSAEAVEAICERHHLGQLCGNPGSSHLPVILVESLAIDVEALPQAFQQEDTYQFTEIPQLSEEDLREGQRMDPEIGLVIRQLELNDKPYFKTIPPELILWFKEWNRLELRNGVLFRRSQKEGNSSYQLVLPAYLRSAVLRELHDEMGHMGIERTLDLVRSRFFWPKMASAVEKKVKTCERCVRRKTLPEKAAPLVNIRTSRPLELVCMDFLSLEPDLSNTKDILVITDHFTKYAVAVPTRNQKAQTVAKCLWENFLVHYGFPEKLHSDQGTDFESRTIKELCKCAGISKTRTTPYHPRGNPVERFNRTLLQMLGTLNNKEKSRWKDYVKPLVHAYNCTKSDVTGFCPYELMFGRQPRLPVDLAFGLPVDSQSGSHSKYVQDLKKRLEESYKVATGNASKVAERNKKRYDKHVVASTLQVGDRVLVKNVRLRGKHKLADKWEPDIYIVIKKAGDLPVYTVTPERKSGPLRTLHRDLLLPCGFLSTPDEPVERKVIRKPITRARCAEDPEEFESVSECSESDYDPVDHYAPERSFEIETRILSNPKPVFSTGSRRTVHLPGAEPVMEKDKGCPSPKEPAENGNLPDMEFSNVQKADHPTSEESVEGDPSDLPEVKVLDESSVDRSGDENEPMRNCEKLDAEGEQSSGNAHREGSILSPQTESATPCDSQHNQSELTETGGGLRRSRRQCEPPKRLQYPQLGNPLSLVIQSLLSSLSTAITTNLEDPLK